MAKRVILGLDVSTTCLGTSIVAYDGEDIKVLYVHYLKFNTSKKWKGTDSLFYKSLQFKEIFIPKIKEWGVTDIIIEEPLPMSNNAIVVNTLMKFNGMISESIFEATGIIPTYISSYDARKYAFPELIAVRKYNKQDEEYNLNKVIHSLKNDDVVLFGNYPWSCAKKMILWNKIVDIYPDIKWQYDENGELKVENFDASDSLICILGMINKEKYGDEQPKVLKYEILETNRYTNVIGYTISFCNKIFNKNVNISKK